jgi:hypothetical protein
LKINKNEKGIQKLPPPPSYFARRTTEEIPLKFDNKLCGKFYFIFTKERMAGKFINNKMP